MPRGFWRASRPRIGRREGWREAASAVGGTFAQGKRASADTVSVAHGPWTIVLETYTVHSGESSVTYTRAKALFVGQGDPRVRIRKRNVFDALLERLGFDGASSARGPLAGRYVVKVRPESLLRSLTTPGLVDALLADSGVTIKAGKAPRKHRKAHGPQVCQAEVYAGGVVREPSRLVRLITICQETLTALEVAGMATRGGVEEAPR